MWFKFRDENGARVSRNSDTIVKFGDYSLLKDGLTITFDDGYGKLVDMFFTTAQLDEIYGKLNERQNPALLRTRYTPKAIREETKRAMREFLNKP